MKIGNEEHSDLCLGIDLGTTNTVAATINTKPNGNIVSKVIELPRAVDMYSNVASQTKLSTQKRATLPSAIYYREEKGYEPLVGDFAKNQYSMRPHLVSKSVKSQMGNQFVSGLSDDIPDKTPAEVSSRILRHIITQAEKIYRCNINDAVITVPANFNPVMCKATRDAAELAGIKVKNSDGSERPVLLSEPNAVIYDLINQVHNGEISNHIIDLDSKKNVLVFDLGGGTLDITFHIIQRREDIPDVLKVEEVATNRYTLLGGDNFDKAIAEEMYRRYEKQYAKHPEVLKIIRSRRNDIMPQFVTYAEQLKIDVNESCNEDYSSGWFDDENEDDYAVGGSVGGVGYAYDDSFSKEEVESILSCFMGYDLEFDDYKKISKLSSSQVNNIIYPVLDVLSKASAKLKEEDVKVDAVIVNGGMSKFYMVIDRLTSFFGFDPIVALDPDQSVARGASVYHYYLHKYESLKDDMIKNSEALSCEEDLKKNSNTYNKLAYNRALHDTPAIEWSNTILNDSLYLGVRNGTVHMIVPTGADLPYVSEVQTGFKLCAGQSRIAVPIKVKNLDGTYKTIASGNINFSKYYADGAYVSFVINMSANKVITMEAWTSKDVEGFEKVEKGNATITIGEDISGSGCKIVPPSGSRLDAVSETNTLLQLMKQKKQKNSNKSRLSKMIADAVALIISSSNHEDFESPVLNVLENDNIDYEIKERFFTLSRKIGNSWSDHGKKRLSNVCMDSINPALYGLSVTGIQVNCVTQAIYTLSMCGSKKQVDSLSKICNKSRFYHPCLYCFGKTKTQVDWIYNEFKMNMKKCLEYKSNYLASTAYAVGNALKKEEGIVMPDADYDNIVKTIIKAINSACLHSNELICCIIALGLICDNRSDISTVSDKFIYKALDMLKNIEKIYPASLEINYAKARTIAIKLMEGGELSEDEEMFLLTKLDIA